MVTGPKEKKCLRVIDEFASVLQPAVYSARNRLLYIKVKNIAISSFQIMMTIIYNKPLVAGFDRKGKCVICCGHMTQV